MVTSFSILRKTRFFQNPNKNPNMCSPRHGTHDALPVDDCNHIHSGLVSPASAFGSRYSPMRMPSSCISNATVAFSPSNLAAIHTTRYVKGSDQNPLHLIEGDLI